MTTRSLIISLFASLITLSAPLQTLAHTISNEPAGFSPSLIITDSNFLKSDTMDGTALNAFLASKGSWLADYIIPEYMTVPYFCRNEAGNTETRTVSVRQWHVSNFAVYGMRVADLLADRARVNAINPQVILTLIERESSGITRAAPTSDFTRAWPLFYNFDETMATYGYACAVAEQKTIDYGGLGLQIAYGTYGIKKNYTDSTDWQSAITIDGTTFTPHSRASRALYRYTPHIHNGNHNFWYLFTKWFSTIIPQPDEDFRVVKTNLEDTLYLHDQTNNVRYHIRSMAALNAWGLYTSDVVLITSGTMELIPTRPGAITRLIKSDNNAAVYYMENGRRHHIRSGEALQAYSLNWNELSNLPDSLVDQVPYGHALAIPVRGGSSDEVFLVTNGRKWYFDSYFTVRSWGHTWSDIKKIPDTILYPYPQSRLDIVAKGTTSSQVFVMIDGKKYPVPNAETYNHFGLRWDRIATFGAETLIQYPQANQLTRLIKGSGPEVYLMENGFRRHVTSVSALAKTGFSLSQLTVVPDYFLNAFAVGSPIK